MLVVSSTPVALAEAPAAFPSRMVNGLRTTCLETCQEKEDRVECARYCHCHLFELRRDITDRQLEKLLLTAERGGENAEAIRAWILRSAKTCEVRVFGEKERAGEGAEAKQANEPGKQTRSGAREERKRSAAGSTP